MEYAMLAVVGQVVAYAIMDGDVETVIETSHQTPTTAESATMCVPPMLLSAKTVFVLFPKRSRCLCFSTLQVSLN
jgi:hypothetical protein